MPLSSLATRIFIVFMIGLGLVLTPSRSQAQIGNAQKITDGVGAFSGTLHDGDRFGTSVTSIGDLDGNGVPDVAIGAERDEEDVCCSGAVWIVLLKSDGSVKAQQKITDGAGGFGGALQDDEFFGRAVAGIGDLDGDSVPDLAVGTSRDDDGGRWYNSPDYGAVWILFLNADGTVSTEQKISLEAGGFMGSLSKNDYFGGGVTALGDLDGNGVTDLAVGAPEDDDGGGDFAQRGAVWILFLNNDGTVKDEQKISDTAGGFGGTLVDDTRFGTSVSAVGDLDGNGALDLAVGTDSTVGADYPQGSLWVLFLNTDGTVKSQQKISAQTGGFSGSLGDQDNFGYSVAGLGDLDGDGVGDLATGAPYDPGDGVGGGAAWILYLNADGTVAGETKISDTEGGFSGTLRAGDRFGSALTRIADLDANALPRSGGVDADGVADLAVGAPFDEGSGAGATWVLFGEASLLPVELTGFDARLSGDDAVALRWKTASETNNAGFEIQRRIAGETNESDNPLSGQPDRRAGSTADENWQIVGKMGGAGTTTQPQTYRFTDGDLPYAADRLTYRLKQVDTDGTTSVSDPVTVERRAVEQVQLLGTAPNPARSQATVRFSIPESVAGETATLRLYDVLGRAVRTLPTDATTGRHTLSLDTSGLPSGVYVLRLEMGEIVKTQRLTVVQ